jgi:hypothetical protein
MGEPRKQEKQSEIGGGRFKGKRKAGESEKFAQIFLG